MQNNLKITEKIYRHVTENANHFLLFYMFIYLFAVFLQVDHRYHISDHRYAKGRLKKRLKAKKINGKSKIVKVTGPWRIVSFLRCFSVDHKIWIFSHYGLAITPRQNMLSFFVNKFFSSVYNNSNKRKEKTFLLSPVPQY